MASYDKLQYWYDVCMFSFVHEYECISPRDIMFSISCLTPYLTPAHLICRSLSNLSICLALPVLRCLIQLSWLQPITYIICHVFLKLSYMLGQVSYVEQHSENMTYDQYSIVQHLLT